MKFTTAGSGAGALDVGDDFRWSGKGGLLCEGGGGGDGDVAVGFGEESVDLRGLLCDGGQGAAFEGAFGAWVCGGGDGFGDGLRHLCGRLINISAKTRVAT